MIPRSAICAALVAALAACGPSYSPDTYASSAVQQANKVEQGVIVGVRDVAVTTSGVVGGVSGATAGAIAGSQAGAGGAASALTALGGSLVGGLAGSAAEHVVSDTKAFEYIIRKPNGDLVSVTQKDAAPLALGQKVLVIAGNQARVVPDYTVVAEPAAKEKPPQPAAEPASVAVKPAEETASQPAADTPSPAAKPADVPPLAPAASKPADDPPDRPKVESGP